MLFFDVCKISQQYCVQLHFHIATHVYVMLAAIQSSSTSTSGAFSVYFNCALSYIPFREEQFQNIISYDGLIGPQKYIGLTGTQVG
jgi:hypothetical protein